MNNVTTLALAFALVALAAAYATLVLMIRRRDRKLDKCYREIVRLRRNNIELVERRRWLVAQLDEAQRHRPR